MTIDTVFQTSGLRVSCAVGRCSASSWARGTEESGMVGAAEMPTPDDEAAAGGGLPFGGATSVTASRGGTDGALPDTAGLPGLDLAAGGIEAGGRIGFLVETDDGIAGLTAGFTDPD